MINASSSSLSFFLAKGVSKHIEFFWLAKLLVNEVTSYEPGVKVAIPPINLGRNNWGPNKVTTIDPVITELDIFNLFLGELLKRR